MVTGGARWIQIREKETTAQDLARAALELVAALPAEVRLFVNDRTDVALAVGADGVHVGDSDLPPKLIRRIPGANDLIVGLSTHSVEDALFAADDDAVDYVAIGPIFESRTKGVRAPLGLRVIEEIRRGTEKPIVAIGGIDSANIGDVIRAGADSAAVIQAIFDGGDISGNVRRLLSAASGTS
jgi:thiamine-phosphate pyrophosphorylase